MKKVTGIGGIFFKCKDPGAINEWYKTYPGFETTPYGTSFEWRQLYFDNQLTYQIQLEEI
ncbi:MAG: hypothetical protein ACRDEB_04790 [Chitinophagaceae bacterium]